MSLPRKVLAGLGWMTLAVLLVQSVEGQERVSDPEWLADTLNLVSGSVVADIGAAPGVLAASMSEAVGPTGTVFATELSGQPLTTLQGAIDSAGVANVRVVEGHAERTNLPAQCCDGIILRGVYHHFTNPAAMNASIFTALKPGGRLAVIDFAPDGEESTDPAGRGSGEHHGITVSTLRRELEEAGLMIIDVDVRPAWNGIYLVAERSKPNR